MIAKNLISNSLPPLNTADTVGKALAWMNEFHLQHLPIVDKNEFIAIVSEYELIDIEDVDITLGEIDFKELKIWVNELEHVFDVIKMIHKNQLSIIPVLDQKEEFIGTISHENIIRYFATASAFQDPGAILVLEIPLSDYSMSEIAQIIESNDALILSSYASLVADGKLLEITLKLNRQEISTIVSTFERYEYVIKASFQESDYNQDFKERLDSFFNYLDI